MPRRNSVNKMLNQREFWVGMAGVVGTSLILIDWYRDRYASAETRYQRIKQDYVVPLKSLYKMRHELLKDMTKGLCEDDEISSDNSKRESSLQMLSTKIFSLPTGDETGTYYTLDWGGSNSRAVRITLHPRRGDGAARYETKQLQQKLPMSLMTTRNPDELFDHLALQLKELMHHTKDLPNTSNISKSLETTEKNGQKVENFEEKSEMNGSSAARGCRGPRVARTGVEGALNDLKKVPPCDFPLGVQGYRAVGNTLRAFDLEESPLALGFCFSFPMRQPALNSGFLTQWSKGFSVPHVVRRDVVPLLQSALERVLGEELEQNRLRSIRIESCINDTVGTLLSCAYERSDARVSLILGTGANIAYLEPLRNDEIINVEVGNFDKLLPRVPPDFLLDEETPNQGRYLLEKMVSGMYLGELARLLCIEVFREEITDWGASSRMNQKWGLGAYIVSSVLEWSDRRQDARLVQLMRGELGLKTFGLRQGKVLCDVCRLVVHRSADLAATMLAGVLEKTGLYVTHREDLRNPFEEDVFELAETYKKDEMKCVSVGIDGSVYLKCWGYERRVRETLERLLGREIVSRVRMERTADGSGRGAALAAIMKAQGRIGKEGKNNKEMYA